MKRLLQILIPLLVLTLTAGWGKAATITLGGTWQTQIGDVWPDDFQISISYDGRPAGTQRTVDGSTTGWLVPCSALIAAPGGPALVTGSALDVQLRNDGTARFLRFICFPPSGPALTPDPDLPFIYARFILPSSAITTPNFLPAATSDWALSTATQTTVRASSNGSFLGVFVGQPDWERNGALTTATIVPEPSSLFLLATAASLASARRRRQPFSSGFSSQGSER